RAAPIRPAIARDGQRNSRCLSIEPHAGPVRERAVGVERLAQAPHVGAAVALEADDDVVRVPITRPADVVQALRRVESADLIVLTRGGGEGLEALDQDDLLGAVAAAPVPVAVALGHATNDLVLDRVADATFPTPTGFGAWLRHQLEERRDRATEAAEAAAVTRSRELLDQLGRPQQTQAALAWWRGAALALRGLLGVGGVWFPLGLGGRGD